MLYETACIVTRRTKYMFENSLDPLRRYPAVRQRPNTEIYIWPGPRACIYRFSSSLLPKSSRECLYYRIRLTLEDYGFSLGKKKKSFGKVIDIIYTGGELKAVESTTLMVVGSCDCICIRAVPRLSMGVNGNDHFFSFFLANE